MGKIKDKVIDDMNNEASRPVYINPDLYTVMKLYGETQYLTVAQVVEQAIEEYLENEK